MALTDKLTDIADAIREVGGTTAKLTPAEMPDAIEKLGAGEYPTLVMYQGQTLTVACDLAKADGTAWEMPSTDTLALHLWHGADTLDASGSTTTLSVDVPADAVTKTWHWTLVLSHGGTDYLVALGDAECRAEGTAKERRISGVVDKARKALLVMNSQYANYYWLDSRKSTKVGGYAFQGNTMRHASLLKVAQIESDNAFFACKSLHSVELPVCTSVGGNAFSSCYSLASVELPACTSVGGNAFSSCYSLASVELPACTSVGGYAFNVCASLASIELPACTSVGGYAFRLSGLRSVELPVCKTVATSSFETCMNLRKASLPACTSMGATAFYQCGQLSVVLLAGDTVCSLTGTNAFGRTAIVRDGCGYIYVNDNLVDDYKAATNWSAYAAYIRPISEWDGTIPDLPDSTGWDD